MYAVNSKSIKQLCSRCGCWSPADWLTVGDGDLSIARTHPTLWDSESWIHDHIPERDQPQTLASQDWKKSETKPHQAAIHFVVLFLVKIEKRILGFLGQVWFVCAPCSSYSQAFTLVIACSSSRWGSGFLKHKLLVSRNIMYCWNTGFSVST